MSPEDERRWDYTALAASYDDRAPYAGDLVSLLSRVTDLAPGNAACDMGAGTGALTRLLLRLGLSVVAIEPNEAMRQRGQVNLSGASVRWVTATAERSGMTESAFSLVSFGSSFNVTNRPAALQEAARILAGRGWLLLTWNHRDLFDPLQAGIEEIIRDRVPGYDHGNRREDQAALLRECGAFGDVRQFDLPVLHELGREQFSRAWRSHATLQRQSGVQFTAITRAIADYLAANAGKTITVPYTTRVYLARRLP